MLVLISLLARYENLIFFPGKVLDGASSSLAPTLAKVRSALIQEPLFISDEVVNLLKTRNSSGFSHSHRLQETVMRSLQNLVERPYNKDEPAHEGMLISLWHAVCPGVKLEGPVCEQWRGIGFQNAGLCRIVARVLMFL
jgi:hypothetical protein